MKSTKAIVLQRMKDVSAMLIKGFSREDIVQYSSENWNIGERQTDKYIQKAKEVISISVQKNVDYEFSKAVRRYEELYKAAFLKKDYKTAMSINKEITALQGLYKNQIEHSGTVQFISNIPD